LRANGETVFPEIRNRMTAIAHTTAEARARYSPRCGILPAAGMTPFMGLLSVSERIDRPRKARAFQIALTNFRR
jgi:hypothetical protein